MSKSFDRARRRSARAALARAALACATVAFVGATPACSPAATPASAPATPAGPPSAPGRPPQSVALKVSFKPNRAGARTTISFGFHIAGPGGSVPSPIVRMDLRLPAHMGIATTTLGQANCEPKALILDGLAGCSENARLGFGDAVAVVPVPQQSVTERASLTALMGPSSSERLEVLFYAEGLTPVFATFVFPGVVLDDSNPFGERIDTLIPVVPSWPEGPNVALTDFRSTIGPLHLTYHRQVNGRTIAYQPHGIRVPRRCPRGGFPFGADLSFEDGTTTHATAHVPCPRR